MEGPQAEMAASKGDLGRFFEYFRRMVPFLEPLLEAQAAAPAVTQPEPPTERNPRPPTVMINRRSRVDPPRDPVPYSASSASAIHPTRNVQLPKKYKPLYRLSQREYRDPNTVSLQVSHRIN